MIIKKGNQKIFSYSFLHKDDICDALKEIAIIIKNFRDNNNNNNANLGLAIEIINKIKKLKENPEIYFFAFMLYLKYLLNKKSFDQIVKLKACFKRDEINLMEKCVEDKGKYDPKKEELEKMQLMLSTARDFISKYLKREFFDHPLVCASIDLSVATQFFKFNDKYQNNYRF